jgi:hypothetical protein
MDQNFQTSFIPKKPIVEERAATTSSQPVSILLIASLFIFFVVLLGTGGLYFYKISVTKNLASLQNSLTLAQNNFEPSEITQLQLLNKRLQSATEILSNHIAITPIFVALEQVTMHTVRFTKFSYDLGKDEGANVDIKMSGMAVDYRSVALQSDLLGQNKNFINPVFSNLTLDSSGDVLFDLDFSVPASFVNYKQSILTQTQS